MRNNKILKSYGLIHVVATNCVKTYIKYKKNIVYHTVLFFYRCY